MNENSKISVVKYIIGQADESETEEVLAWIRSSEENELFYIQAYEAWQKSLLAEATEMDVDAAYTSFIEKRTNENKWVKLERIKVSRIALAALFILLCSAALYIFKLQNSPSSLIIFKVPNGKSRRVTLPDGTNVWVNAGSELIYSQSFNKTDRTVSLRGEAYFDIAEEDLRKLPFLVKANNYTIRDVGTVFNVKSYPGDNVFETTVVEGKVSVEGKLLSGSDQESKVFLEKSQVLKINTSGSAAASISKKTEPLQVIQLLDYQLEEYSGWKDDLLIFDGDRFGDIARILERRYNVQIVFEDKELQTYQYSGTFKNVGSISKILQVIKENTAIHYNQTDSVITIRKN